MGDEAPQKRQLWFHLSAADGQRLGLTDGVRVDLADITIDQSRQLEVALQLTPMGFLLAANAKTSAALLALVWLALHQAGRPVDLAEVKFSTYGIVYPTPKSGGEAAGKDPSVAPASTTSATT